MQPIDGRLPPLPLPALGSLGMVLLWQMPCEVHALVKHAANFDTAIINRSVQQEVPRATDTANSLIHTIATMAKMVGSGRCDDFRAAFTAGTIRILCHVENALEQEGLITQSRPRTELLMSPSENRRNISLSGRCDRVSLHGISRQPFRPQLLQRHAGQFDR